MGRPVAHTQQIALSVIVPVYNGEAFIAGTVRELLMYLAALPRAAELIVVDDGSTDKTVEVLREAVAGAPIPVRLLEIRRNRGKGAAICRGMRVACGEQRLFLDADLAYPPSEIEHICRALSDGADVAVASRVHGNSRYVVSPSFFRYLYTRHVAGRIFNWLVRLVLLPGITDSQAGLKGFTAAAADQLFAERLPNGFSFDLAVLSLSRRLALRIEQIGVLYRYDSEATTVRFLLDTIIVLRDLVLIRLRVLHRMPDAWGLGADGRLAAALRSASARGVLLATTGCGLIALVVTRLPVPNGPLAMSAWLTVLAGLAVFALRADMGVARVGVRLFRSRGEFWLFAAIFAACAFLRLAYLRDVPPMVHLDTAECGLLGLTLWQGNEVGDVFDFSPWYNTPYLSFLPYAASFAMVGPTILGLRLPSAVLGIATIIPLYLLVRSWFGIRAAALTAALFAVSHAAIHFSRIGLWNIQVLFYEVTAFALLAAGVRRGSAFWSAAAGAVSGLALYSYTAGRLIPVVAVPFLVVQLVRGQRRRIARIAAYYLAGLAIAVCPLVLNYVKDPTVLEIDRTASVWVLAETHRYHVEATLGTASPSTVLWEQLKRSLAGFVSLGDTSTQYGTEQPLLSPWMALLCAIGVVIALRRIRDARYLFLILWSALGLILGSVLILDPPSYTRLIIMFPVPYIFGAVCLQTLLDMARRWIRLRRADVAAIYVLVIALSGVFNLTGYWKFVNFMNQMPREWDVLRVLNRLGGRYDYYLFTGPFLLADSPIFSFFSTGTRAVTGFSEQDLPDRLPHDSAFVLIPEFQHIGIVITEKYPGVSREVIQRDGRRMMFVYRCEGESACRQGVE